MWNHSSYIPLFCLASLSCQCCSTAYYTIPISYGPPFHTVFTAVSGLYACCTPHLSFRFGLKYSPCPSHLNLNDQQIYDGPAGAMVEPYCTELLLVQRCCTYLHVYYLQQSYYITYVRIKIHQDDGIIISSVRSECVIMIER